MPIEVIMPKVDMDMTEGTIMTWHVAEGELVEKGAPLFDIETAKAAMEVEAPANGRFHHPVEEGTVVPIGQPVAWLYAEGEEVGNPPVRPATTNEVAKDPEPPAADVATSAPVAAADVGEVDVLDAPFRAGGKMRATPLARTLARNASVPLESLDGSGPLGRVQADDVKAFLERAIAFPIAAHGSVKFETGPLAIHRSRSGIGAPVVMIHGFASDSKSWAPLETHLKGRPLIRIDLPAHGKSPSLRVDSFADLLGMVRGAFDELDLEQVDLLGHSLGGALALALADTRPRSIRSLSLIAPAGLGPEIDGDVLSGICRAARSESLKPWLAGLVFGEGLISDAYARVVMNERSDPNLRAAQGRLADVLFPDGTQAFDLRAALHRLEMPARIIWGRNDAIIPWKHALRAPGNVALHLFDRVGHMPQFECADVLGPLLREVIS